jgi:hypothetical protein
MGIGKTILLQTLALVATVVSVLAADTVTIQQLQANPDSFDNRIVTLRGSVHQIQFLAADSECSSLKPLDGNPPLELPCWMIRPAYTFVLADDTGFQQILVKPLLASKGTAPCIAARGQAPPPDVGEGDRIALDVLTRVARQQQGTSEIKTLEVYAVSIQHPGR